MIYVGEPTVARANGLYSPPGFIVLLSLYCLLFASYDLLAKKYRLTFGALAWLNVAVYSIGITGFLHGELQNFAKPDEWLITLLIRIQCSFFPLFAYYVLRKFGTNDFKPPSAGKVIAGWIIFIAVLSMTSSFGLQPVLNTLQHVPVISMVSLAIAVGALFMAFRPRTSYRRQAYSNPALTRWCVALGVLGLIPFPAALLTLLVVMPIVAGYYLKLAGFRDTLIT